MHKLTKIFSYIFCSMIQTRNEIINSVIRYVYGSKRNTGINGCVKLFPKIYFNDLLNYKILCLFYIIIARTARFEG